MVLDTRRLLRVGTAKAKDQAAWLEGVALERDAGHSLLLVRQRVSAARFQLAKEMRAYSAYAKAAPRPMHREVISRSYYCMYHAIRAAAYMHYGGDDHQGHSELPQKVPLDFPNQAVWGNQLKSAREYRNQADYDPYPKSEVYWRTIAATVSGDADNLVPVARAYLRAKGCNV